MENYEKKYKDLVEAVKQLQKANPSDEGIQNWINDNVPELAGSEGERIRGAIMHFISHTPTVPKGIINKEQMLAWLEKQGSEPNWCHHKVDLSNCSEEYRKAYYDGWNNCNQQHSQCKSERNDVVKCLINGMKFYYEDNEEATWGTEKFSMKVKDILSWLEKQGEQNPYSGVSISHDNGVDILFDKKLVKHISGEKQDGQKPYGQREECVDCQFNYAGECKGSCAMKRGEQKSTNKVEPLDEFSGLTDFERTLADICIGWIGKEIGWKQYIKDNADALLQIAVEKFNSVQDVTFEQKAAWSEEDEEIIEKCIGAVRHSCYSHSTKIKAENWLKSIKQRIGE